MNFKCKYMEIFNKSCSLNEICEYLGVSGDTVFKWLDNKNMTAHKMFRQLKFMKLIIELNSELLRIDFLWKERHIYGIVF